MSFDRKLPLHQKAMLEIGYNPEWDNESQRILWHWPYLQKAPTPVLDAAAREVYGVADGDKLAMFCRLCGFAGARDGWWAKGHSLISPETAQGIYQNRKLDIPF